MNRPIQQQQRTLYGTEPLAQYLTRPLRWRIAVPWLHSVCTTVARRGIPPARVLVLALRTQLSADDAACLWVAAELKAPPAGFDEKPACAAQEHLAALV